MSQLELFRAFALSNEFTLFAVRQNVSLLVNVMLKLDADRLCRRKLLGLVPVPVKETVEELAAKMNVLLQVYISQLKFEGFALVADMVYAQQSVGREVFNSIINRGSR